MPGRPLARPAPSGNPNRVLGLVGAVAVALAVVGGGWWLVGRGMENKKALAYNEAVVASLQQVADAENRFFEACSGGNRQFAEESMGTVHNCLDKVAEEVTTTELPSSGGFFRKAIQTYLKTRRNSFDARTSELLDLAGDASLDPADREAQVQAIVDEMVAADAGPMDKLDAEQRKFADRFGFRLE